MITFRHTHTLGRAPLDEESAPSQRPLPDNTQQSQETGIHALAGIRTRNLSKRQAADPRLRPRGHQDRLSLFLCLKMQTGLKHKHRIYMLQMYFTALVFI